MNLPPLILERNENNSRFGGSVFKECQQNMKHPTTVETWLVIHNSETGRPKCSFLDNLSHRSIQVNFLSLFLISFNPHGTSLIIALGNCITGGREKSLVLIRSLFFNLSQTTQEERKINSQQNRISTFERKRTQVYPSTLTHPVSHIFASFPGRT